MRVYYDLHIHSSLSPCADETMTPNNIANMAKIKGLDIIAVVDHNSTKNCQSVLNVGSGIGLIVIPGAEVQTKEEVHVVCLFKDIETTKKFQIFLEDHYIGIKNVVSKFGTQQIFDEEDEVIGEEENALIFSVDISVNNLYKKVTELGGVFIPAHINKGSNSMLTNLGFIPPDADMKIVEVTAGEVGDRFLKNNEKSDKYKEKYLILRNSDAHNLGMISEKENYLELENKSAEALFKALKSKCEL